MPVKVYSANILSGASSCQFPTMPAGAYITCLEIGTMSTAVQMMLYASLDEGATYRQMYTIQQNTSTVAANSFCVLAGIGTAGGVVVVPPGHRNLQIRGTAVVSGGVAFKIIALDDN